MYLMNRLSVSFLKKLSEGIFFLDDREKNKRCGETPITRGYAFIVVIWGIGLECCGLTVLSAQEPLHTRAECRWAAWWYRQRNHRHSTWLGIESGGLLWCPAAAAWWLARFWFLWRYHFILVYANTSVVSELKKWVFLKCILRGCFFSYRGNKF